MSYDAQKRGRLVGKQTTRNYSYYLHNNRGVSNDCIKQLEVSSK